MLSCVSRAKNTQLDSTLSTDSVKTATLGDSYLAQKITREEMSCWSRETGRNQRHFMLHSDQNCPGTPMLHGSKTGIVPVEQKHTHVHTHTGMNTYPRYTVHIFWLLLPQSRVYECVNKHLGLHHGWSLCSQHFDSLEDVDHSFITHPLQHYAQRDKDTCSPNTSTATHALQLYNNTVHVITTHRNINSLKHWGKKKNLCT